YNVHKYTISTQTAAHPRFVLWQFDNTRSASKLACTSKGTFQCALKVPVPHHAGLDSPRNRLPDGHIEIANRAHSRQRPSRGLSARFSTPYPLTPNPSVLVRH